jgi:hypothetical protein
VRAAAALVTLRGTGYTRSFSDRGFDPGLVAGLRLSRAGQGMVLWVGVDVTGHVVDRVARVEGLASSWRFPRVDAQFSVGLGHRWGP